jgi:sucrose phosphorylase
MEIKYKDFFINWNEFWKGTGVKGGWYYNSKAEYLNKLFMRKSGLV